MLTSFEQRKKTEAWVALPDDLFTKDETNAIILDCYLQLGKIHGLNLESLKLSNWGESDESPGFSNWSIYMNLVYPLEWWINICFSFRKAKKIKAAWKPERLNFSADKDDNLIVNVWIEKQPTTILIENEQEKARYVKFLLDKSMSIVRQHRFEYISKIWWGVVLDTMGILTAARRTI